MVHHCISDATSALMLQKRWTSGVYSRLYIASAPHFPTAVWSIPRCKKRSKRTGVTPHHFIRKTKVFEQTFLSYYIIQIFRLLPLNSEKCFINNVVNRSVWSAFLLYSILNRRTPVRFTSLSVQVKLFQLLFAIKCRLQWTYCTCAPPPFTPLHLLTISFRLSRITMSNLRLERSVGCIRLCYMVHRLSPSVTKKRYRVSKAVWGVCVGEFNRCTYTLRFFPIEDWTSLS